MNREAEVVDHPIHYGGEEDPYEAIKVIEAWGLGFHLGNAIKYIRRAPGERGSVNREARREFNRESFDLWLVTRGDSNPTGIPGHPDAYHGRSGKPGSRVNQDDYWVEATSTPDARATDMFFERVLSILAGQKPAIHTFFMVFYASDPAGVERLRETLPTSAELGSEARIVVRAIDAAIEFVLDRADAERRLLYWPSPDSAKGYVERNVRKRRDATYMYHRERSSGVSVELAVQRASAFARCSRRAVYYWIANDTTTKERNAT